MLKSMPDICTWFAIVRVNNQRNWSGQSLIMTNDLIVVSPSLMLTRKLRRIKTREHRGIGVIIHICTSVESAVECHT